ncbi:MAG TPA: hypothetical protein VF533_06810 [Solirubrobacteraceae bacterium]|jgi:hypothetical protein
MTIRLRSILFLLLAALAAVALGACGGSGKEATEDTDVNTLLKNTFSGDKKVESGRLDLSLAIDAKGTGGTDGPVNVKLGGPFQSQGKQKLPKFKMDASFSGGDQNIKAGVTSTGDRGFVNFNGTDYAVTDQVFKQVQAGYEQAQKEAAKGSKDKQPSLATLGIDPTKWLTDAKNEGEAKVGDTDTIKITGGVDVPKLLDDIDTALGKANSLGLQSTGQQVPERLTPEQRKQIEEGVKDLKVEIYTGKEDSTLRRMVVDLAVDAKSASGDAQSGTLKLDFSLTGLNEDQEITAPANAKPFDELLGQVGGLGGGLGGSGTGGASGSSGSSGSGAQNQKQLEDYTKCITDAGSDTTKAQECAKILSGG